ncbi:MAG: TIGR03643 family protein [Candidatus Marisimplicoccus sp.]
MKSKSLEDIDRIIEMAWEDRTPFEAVFLQFDINEKELKAIMRNNLKKSSFKLWRERVNGRKTKHSKLRDHSVDRFKCNLQRNISNNKISKR